MSDMRMGRIGEYRELSLEELRVEFGRRAREIQALELQAPKEQVKSIAGMFAEALGNLEDALCSLGRVNEQYDPEDYVDEVRLVRDYGLPPSNPAMDFWLQSELAEDWLKAILRRLRRVESLAPKEVK